VGTNENNINKQKTGIIRIKKNKKNKQNKSNGHYNDNDKKHLNGIEEKHEKRT